MTPHIELSKLTETEKDALILALLPLVSQLEAAQKRIAALESAGRGADPSAEDAGQLVQATVAGAEVEPPATR